MGCVRVWVGKGGVYEYALERERRLGYVRFANLVYGTLPSCV